MTTLVYLTVILLYISVTLVIGWKIQKKGFKHIREWMLEKDKIHWFAISMTTLATLYSAFTFVGMPGFFYTHGIGTFIMVTLTVCFPGCFLFYIVSLRILKLNSKRNILTPFELLKKQITTHSPKWFISLSLFIFVIFNIPYIVTQIAGVGKILSQLTNNQIPYHLAAFLMIFSIFIYASWGGMKGIIWTDLFQGIYGLSLLIILSLFLLYFQFDGFFDFIHQLKTQRPELLTLPGPKGKMNFELLSVFVVTLSCFVASYIQIFNRTLLFHTKKDIKMSTLSLFVCSILIGIFVSIIGFGAAILYPNLASGDLAIIEIINHSPLTLWFGHLFGALFFIAILAGSMSTADSVLFALGTSFTNDILKPILKLNLSTRTEKNTIKFFILVFIVICYLFSLNPPQLIIDLSLTSIIGLGVIAPIILTLLWKKLSQTTLLYALLISYSLFIAMQWLGLPNFFNLHPGLYGFLASCLVLFFRIKILKKP